MQNSIVFSKLIVHGPDALAFLQGQLTCDVTAITDTQSFGAYCDQRGRVLANFMIQKSADRFLISLPESMIDTLLQALKKFALFSKVAIEKQDAAPEHSIENNKLDFIQGGIAFVYPETSLLFTPQMINWEKHGGVSFTKGCYVGQEVVARTQHLGKLKRHLHLLLVEYSASSPPPMPGMDIMNAKKEPVGIICDTAKDQNTLYLLAVIQDDAVTQALFFCNQPVTVT